jgi:hypothetical protein
MSEKIPNLYPSGKDRKDAIEKYASDVRAVKDNEKLRGPEYWSYYDSRLVSEWEDEPDVESYHSAFMRVLPDMPGEKKDLKKYIEEVLVHKNGRAIGIDIGGHGSRVFSEFTKGFFARSAGVTLTDLRKRMPNNPTSADTRRHHKVLTGDLLVEKTYNNLDTWLKGEKADLIFERLLGGMRGIPKEPHLLASVLEKWYERLGEGGVMFIQVPGLLIPLLKPWQAEVRRQYPKQLEIQIAEGPVDTVPPYMITTMRLRKLAGAPEKLPMLDSRTVRKLGEVKN